MPERMQHTRRNRPPPAHTHAHPAAAVQTPSAGAPSASTRAVGCPCPCRLLWGAYWRPKWSTKAHAACHPAFKAAVRQLLLVARFGDAKLQEQAEGGGGASPGAVAVDGMGRLPRELVHKIIADAAYPISTWAGCQ